MGFRKQVAAYVLAASVLATAACGSQVNERATTKPAAAEAQPTDESWLDYLVSEAEQNPTSDLGAQDLPEPSYNEFLNDFKAQAVRESALAFEINQAHPTNPAWARFTATDLNNFAEQACRVDAPRAVHTLVSQLPGMVARDAPLMDQVVRLIPQHCRVVHPQWVDYISNVLFNEMVRNTRALPPATQPSGTAAAPTPSASESRTEYQVVCAIGSAGLSTYLSSRADSGRTKYLGLMGLAGAMVFCPKAINWLAD
ncbi:hypothetical protein [Streptomyces sp. NPDC006355]|uniref:hypothetical protein n=1 Tax=Streptomyces sp. NPDC006355 TaxID=3156758 RepID=UPI0033B6866C